MLLCGTAERVFACLNSGARNPYFPQPASPEAALPDVFQFVRENDAHQSFALLECVVLDSLQRGRQLNAFQRAVLKDPVPHPAIWCVLIRPKYLEASVEHHLLELLAFTESTLVDYSHGLWRSDVFESAFHERSEPYFFESIREVNSSETATAVKSIIVDDFQ